MWRSTRHQNRLYCQRFVNWVKVHLCRNTRQGWGNNFPFKLLSLSLVWEVKRCSTGKLLAMDKKRWLQGRAHIYTAVINIPILIFRELRLRFFSEAGWGDHCQESGKSDQGVACTSKSYEVKVACNFVKWSSMIRTVT